MINQERVHWLEIQIDYVNSEISIPGEFIVPGDTPASAALDLARTVVRRSERWVVGLDHAGILENGELLRYLNRLSSLCFALELLEIQKITSNDPTMVR